MYDLPAQGARDLSAKGQAAGLAAAEQRRIMMIDARQPKRVSRGQPTKGSSSSKERDAAPSSGAGGGSIEEWLKSSAAQGFSAASNPQQQLQSFVPSAKAKSGDSR